MGVLTMYEICQVGRSAERPPCDVVGVQVAAPDATGEAAASSAVRDSSSTASDNVAGAGLGVSAETPGPAGRSAAGDCAGTVSDLGSSSGCSAGDRSATPVTAGPIGPTMVRRRVRGSGGRLGRLGRLGCALPVQIGLHLRQRGLHEGAVLG